MKARDELNLLWKVVVEYPIQAAALAVVGLVVGLIVA